MVFPSLDSLIIDARVNDIGRINTLELILKNEKGFHVVEIVFSEMTLLNSLENSGKCFFLDKIRKRQNRSMMVFIRADDRFSFSPQEFGGLCPRNIKQLDSPL